LIIAVVGYVLVRRMMGEPAQAKRMLILPAVLSVIGLTDVSGQLKSPVAVLFLVGSVAISVVLGMLRGASVRITERDGLAFVRYTWVTLVLWVINLAVKFGANLVFGAVDAKDAASVSNGLLLTLGLGILAEGLIVLTRSMRQGHQIVWTERQDGGLRQGSALLGNPGNRAEAQPVAEWNTRRDLRRDRRRDYRR
jgi:hypothetical protein